MPLGFAALSLIDARMLSSIVGIMLLTYGGYFALRRNLPELSGRWLPVEAGIGFVGGILGAMAGLSGALPSMWLAMRPWPKGCSGGSSAIQHGDSQRGDGHACPGWRLDGPCSATCPDAACQRVGAAIGLWLFRKLSDHGYRRLLIGLMLVSGIVLLGRTLPG